jgi:hypothetical protein
MKKINLCNGKVTLNLFYFSKSKKNCDSDELKCFLRHVSPAYLITLYVLYCLVYDFLTSVRIYGTSPAAFMPSPIVKRHLWKFYMQ